MEGPRLKVARARKHTEELKDLVFSYLELNAWRIGGNYERATKTFEFRTHLTKQPPAVLGIVLGDIAHNLRSALDHIAWTLALRTSRGEPSRKTAFPLARSPEDFHGRACQRMLRDIPPKFLALIESLQPYQPRGELDFDPTWLGVLREMSNTDKHRLVVAAPTTFELAGNPRFDFEAIRDVGDLGHAQIFYGGPIDDAVVARIEIEPLGPNPKMNMHLEISASLRVEADELPLKGVEVGAFARHARTAVSAVIRRCEAAL
jgi:hypothetical protein